MEEDGVCVICLRKTDSGSILRNRCQRCKICLIHTNCFLLLCKQRPTYKHGEVGAVVSCPCCRANILLTVKFPKFLEAVIGCVLQTKYLASIALAVLLTAKIYNDACHIFNMTFRVFPFVSTFEMGFDVATDILDKVIVAIFCLSIVCVLSVVIIYLSDAYKVSNSVVVLDDFTREGSVVEHSFTREGAIILDNFFRGGEPLVHPVSTV